MRTNAVHFSPEYKRQLGFDDHELPNQFEAFESRLHPDDHDRVMAGAQRLTEHPNDEYAVEFRLRHRDGSYRWIFTRGAVLLDEGGRPYRMLGSHVDLTERINDRIALETSREELQRLSRELFRAREDERARVAHEIHDELGQRLTALAMDVSWLKRRWPQDSDAISTKLSEMAGAVEQTIDTVRRVATDLRPAVLDDLGLVAAIEWLAQDFQDRSGVACSLDTTHFPPIDRDISTAIFRIAQEALTNVARHARATHVSLSIAYEAGVVTVAVADNGIGMAPHDHGRAQPHLVSLRERARLAGGTVVVESKLGSGTTITARIPWPPAESAS